MWVYSCGDAVDLTHCSKPPVNDEKQEGVDLSVLKEVKTHRKPSKIYYWMHPSRHATQTVLLVHSDTTWETQGTLQTSPRNEEPVHSHGLPDFR